MAGIPLTSLSPSLPIVLHQKISSLAKSVVPRVAIADDVVCVPKKEEGNLRG